MKGKLAAFVAVMAAVMMLSVILVPLAGQAGVSSQQTLQTTGDGQGQDITYHYGSGKDESVTVHYDGIAATEYNPEFWNGSVTGVSSQPANWVGPSVTFDKLSFTKSTSWSFWWNSSATLAVSVPEGTTVTLVSGSNIQDNGDNTFSTTRRTGSLTLSFTVDSVTVNKVFAGWSTTDGGSLDYYPGDVVPSSVTDLYAVWAEPSIYVNGTNEGLSQGSTTRWVVTFDTYKTITSSSIDPTVDRARESKHSDRMFVDIMVLGNNISSNSIETKDPCTIRSSNGSNITFATIRLGGDTIFDNISLTSNRDPTNHGDNSSSGIFANGHKLILGTGIGTEATAHTRAPQVFGGRTSAVTSAVMTDKEIVSADTAFTTRPDLGTFVLVHSGVYYNLVAGGVNAPIGSSSVHLSTYMVLKGGVVLDTVVGGSGSGQDNTDASIYGEASPTTTYDQGGTFIYALGIKMPGDQYHEKQVGTDIAGSLGFTLDESTIMEGGGSGRLDSSSSLRYNQIHGSTHIFLSGDSDIWDVQAGNRRGISGADFAYLEISGNAVVRHVACGTITDGNRHADMTSVDAVRIVVRDNASVASVFGAGYDTWYYPNYSTMDDAISIDVLIKGGTVGSVYGGGYRGSITVSDGIAIEVSGGTILGDVFGGGRGGLDKIMHYADGTIYGEAYLDSTGKSEVNGNIIIAITGGEIRGNVYGGGESVPKLTAYSNLTLTNHPTSNITFNSAPNNVAAVNGNTSVTMSGGVVKGSIYGGGKGVLKENGTIYDQPMQVPALKGTSGSYEYVDILWNDNGVPTYDTSMSYLGYAAVSGDTSVSVSAGAVVEGNVYGGGRVGNVGGDAYVSIGASEVKTVIGGSVYGAGLGSQYSDDYGFVGSGSVTIANGSIGGSVYGGGAYGSMNDVAGASGDVHVIIDGSDITGDVYGGGRGSAAITGQGNVNDVTMTVTDSTVRGSIYGGGAYGTSASVSAIITGCTVDGSVYGGGLGIANRVSVTGPVSLTLDATEVKGDVYGGSAYGIVDGDIAVELRGGSYAGTVYGGGLGTANVRSTGAKRSVLLDGAKVSNSVYGGSRIGVDGIADTDGYSIVTILDAEIGSNVFGGGYRGQTWGNTYVYIGCDENGAPSSGNIIIGLSVFGGGDVGEATSGDELFNTVLVNGDSEVVIDGTNAKLSFSHSVFGEGNSCLTDGSTVVTIRNVKGLTIQSIQRADSLHMYGSELTFTGRNSGTSSSASELYSFYAIDYMELIGGTILTLNAPLGEVGDFFSMVSDGVLSTATSPINRVYLNEGTVFSLANSNGYGQVYGYTILSLPSIEIYYGAFAYGSVDSSGGFVTEEDGMYRELQRYELTDPLCSYWCIVGAVEITTSAVLKNDPSLGDNALIVENITAGLPMVSAGTTLLYTGGSFTPNSMGSYSLVQGTPTTQRQLAVLMGSGGGTTFNGGKGVYIPDGSSGTSVAVRADATSVTSPTIWLSVEGLNPAFFGYVGTVTIQFSEVMISDSSTEDEQYVFFNTINLSVEIYLEGETLPTSGTLGIDTVNGAGSSDMVMPPADKEGILYLKSVTMNGGSAISMSSVSNREGSNGWNSSHSTWTFSADTSDRIQIGSFNGSFPSTIRFAVEGFDQSSCSYVFEFVAEFNDGTEHPFTITVEVVSYPNVTVTFVDSRQNVTTSMQFPYGSIITSGDAPQTRGNFIGWYYDETFTRAFNYSTPLTGDITLYARYMFTVTFDEMYGGRTSTYYLPMGSSLTLDNHGSKDPVRTGYVFTGWYRDSDCLVLWDFDNDKVEDDVTLYAGWQPRGIILDFYQSHDSTDPFLTFDSKYGISLDDTFGEYLAQAVSEYVSKFGAVTAGVLTWTVHATGVHTPVYSDNVITYTMVTVIGEEWHVSIHGNILYDPIEVVLESTDYGVEISPPSSFYVSPTDGYYMITPSGAERVGYRLTGWTIVATGGFHIVGHTISIPASEIKDYLSGDGKIHLTTSWERLSYMVVVMKPSGGTVFASILTEDGREYGDEYPTYYAFTAYYGDRISLSYTSESGYHFVGWMLSKDGDIDDTSSPTTTMTVRGDARVEVQISGLQNVTIRLSENGTVPLGGTVTLISGDRTYTPRQSGTSGNYGIYSVSALLGEYTLRYTDSDGDYIDIATVNVVTGGVTVSYEIVSIDVTSDPELDLGDLPAYAIPGTKVDLTVPHGYAVTKLERVYDNGRHDMGAVSYFIVPDTQSTGLTVNVSLEAAKYTIEFVIDDYKNGDQTVSFDGIQSIIITYSPDGMVYPTLPWVTLDGYDLNSLDHPTTSEYSFLGWYLDEDFMYRVQSGDAFPEENVTLHARITLRSEVIYKVEVYLQEIGGNYPSTPIVIETTELSDQYVGWRPNYPGFKEESTDYQSVVVAEGMDSITVKMERAKGTATLKLDGGSVVDANGWTVSGNTATREVWFGETVELPTVAKLENVFDGWQINGATVSSIQVGQQFWDQKSNTVSVEVTAKWTVNEYELVFFTMYGTFTNGQSRITVSVPYGAPLASYLQAQRQALIQSDTDLYLNFDGWEINQVTVADDAVMPATNMDVHATWVPKDVNITVTGDEYVSLSVSGNNLSGSDGKYVSVFDSVIDLALLFDDGYSLSSASGASVKPVKVSNTQFRWTVPLNADNVTVGADGTLSLNLNIQSVESTVTVNYVINRVVADSLFQNVPSGQEVVLRNLSGITGLKFDGWYLDEGRSNKVQDNKIPASTSQTTYVVYGWLEFAKTPTVNINAPSLSLVNEVYEGTYDGSNHVLSATADAGVDLDALRATGLDFDIVYTITWDSAADDSVSVIFAGEYSYQLTAGAALSIEGTVADTSDQYGDTVSISIDKANATAVWNHESSYTYNGTDRISTVTAHFIGADGRRYPLTVSVNADAFRNAGEYTFTAVSSDTNHEVSNLTLELTIAKRPLTITQSNTLTYSGQAQSPEFKDDRVSGDTISYSLTGSETDAGTYTITFGTLSGADAGNYEPPTSVTWRIGRVSVSDITWTVKGTYTYTGQPIVPEVTAAGTAADMQSGTDYRTSGIQGMNNVNAGTAYVLVEGIGNYSGTWTLEFQIGKQTVQVPSVDEVPYTGSQQTNPYEALASEGGFTVSGTDVAATNPGTYKVTLTLTDTANRVWSDGTASIEAEWVIDQPSLATVPDSVTLTYNGRTQTAYSDGTGYTVVSGGSGSKAGEYTVVLRVAPGYVWNIDTVDTADKEVTWTIGKAGSITVTADSDTKKYDGSPLINDGFTYTGTLYNGDTVEAVISGTITNFGIATNTVVSVKVVNTAGEDVTDCYTYGTHVNGELSITKRSVTLTSASATETYDRTVLLPQIVTVTGDGFAAGEGATYKFTGGQKTVGTSVNTFDYTLNSNTLAANYDITKVEGTLTVNSVTLTIQWGTTEFKYNGKQQIPTATLNGIIDGDTVGYKTSVNGGAVNAGSYTLTISLDGADAGNYVLSSTDHTTFTIAKRQVTLASASESKPYDGIALTNGNITVTGDWFADGEGATYDVTGSILFVGNVVNAFSYTLNPGTLEDNYEITKSEGTLTITRHAGITVTADSNRKDYDGTPLTDGGYQITGTLAQGDSISVTISGSQTTVGYSANTVTEVKITRDGADVADQYQFVNRVNGTLTVVTRSLVNEDFSFTPDSHVYTGSAITGTLSPTNWTPADGDYSVRYEDNTNTGTARVIVTGSGNCEGEIEYTWVIRPKAVTITWSGYEYVYNGNDQRPTFTIGTGIEGQTLDVEGLTVTIHEMMSGNDLGEVSGSVSVGSYRIIIESLNNDNYVLPSNAHRDYSINAKQLTASQSNSLTYNGQSQSPTFSLSGVVGSDDVSVRTDAGGVNAGSYAADISLTGDAAGNYTLASDSVNWSIAALSINSASITISGDTVYTGQQIRPTVDFVKVGEVVVTGYDVSYGLNVNAGTGTVTVTVPSGGNFSGSCTEEFEIGKATVSISWGDKEFVYNGGTQYPTYTLTGVNNNVLTGSHRITLSGTETSPVNAGSYVITVTSISNGNYKLPDDASTGFTIAKKEVSITWNTTSFVYDRTNKTPTFTAETGVSGETVSPGITVYLGGSVVTSHSNVGTYTAGLTLDHVNYVLPADRSTEFSITPATVNVSLSETYFPYDGQTHTVTVSSSGIVGGDNVIVSPAGTLSSSAAGTYTVTLELVGNDAGNYVLSHRSLSWTIGSLSLDDAKIDYDETSFEYDGTQIKPTFQIYVDGVLIPSGHYSVTYGDNTNAGTGTVTVTATGSSCTGSKGFSFVIDQRSVTAQSVTLVYSGAEQCPEAFDLDRIVSTGGGSDDVSVRIISCTSQTDKGTYSASIELTGDDAANYQLTSDTVSWEITARGITDGVSIDNIEDVVFRGTNITPDITATFAGSTLQKDTDYTLGYTANVNVGTVTVTVTGIGNFTGSTTLTFDITPYTVTIEWGTVTEFTYNGETQRPSFTIRGVNVTLIGTYTVSGASDTSRNVGEYTITITGIQGNTLGNYELPTDHSKGFEILQKEVTIQQSNELVYNEGSQSPEFSIVGLIAGDDVSVSTTASATNAGDYKAQVYLIGTHSGNYRLVSTEADWSIAKASLGLHLLVEELETDTQKPIILTESFTEKYGGTVEWVSHDFDEEYIFVADNVIYPKAKGKAVVEAFISGMTNYEDDGWIIVVTVHDAEITGVTVKGYTGVYDGQEHNMVEVSGVSRMFNMAFSTNGTDYVSEMPKVRDVADSGTVYVKVEAPGFVTTVFEATVTITRASATVTWGGLSTVYDGSVQTVTAHIGTDELTVSVYQNGAVAEFKDAGTYNVIADISAYLDNYSVKHVIGTAVISKKPVDVSLSSESLVYTGAPLAVTIDQSGLIQADIDGKLVGLSLSGDLVATDVGTYEVVVSLTGSAAINYTIENPTVSWSIEQRSLSGATVSITGGDWVYTGQAIQPTVTVDIEGVDFASNDYRVVYTNNVNAGTATVTVVPGDSGNCSGSVSETFTIAKKTLTFTSPDGKKVYDGTPLVDLNIVAKGFVSASHGFTATVTGSQTDVGSSDNTFTVILTGGASTANYDVKYVYGTLEVTPATIEVAWNVYDMTYDGKEHTFSPFTNGIITGDTVVPTVVITYNDGTVASAVNVGEYTIKVTGITGADARNYELGGTLEASFEITKANAQIVWSGVDATYTYDGTDRKGEIEAVFRDTSNNAEYDLTISYDGFTEFRNAGSYTFTVDISGYSANYEITGQTEVTLTMNRKAISAEQTNSPTYNGMELRPTFELKNLVEGDIVDYVIISGGSAVNAGTYTATIGLTGDAAGNYSIPSPTLAARPTTVDQYQVDWVIGKLSISGADIVIGGYDEVYDANPKTPGVTVTIAGITLGPTDFILSYDNNINAGEAKVTVTATDNSNFTGSEDETFSIEKRKVTITSGSADKLYDRTPLTDRSITIDGFANDHAVQIVWSGTITDVGTVDNTFTYTLINGASADNYHVTVKYGTLEVTARSLEGATIAVAGGSWTYNGSDIEPGITSVTIAGITLDSGEYSVGYTNNRHAGTATITVSASSNNFSGSATANFEIEPVRITVTSESLNKVYDGSALNNGERDVTITNGSFVSGEGFTWTFTGSQTAVGSSQNSFTYAAKEGTIADNYRVTVKYGILEVTVRNLSDNDFTFAQDSEIYTGSEIEGTLTANGWNPQIGDYSVSYSDNINAGPAKVEITASSGNTDGSVILTFEIKQKDVIGATVTLAEGTWTYTGSEIEPDVSSVIIDGLTLVIVRDFTVSYEDNINAGTATVRISGTGNFTGEVTATFTIGEKVLEIDWGTIGTVYNGANQDLDPKLSGIVGTDAVGFDHTLTSGGSTVEHVRNAGDYVYTITGLTGAAAGNYELPAVHVKEFTIAKATITVGLEQYVFTHTGNEHTVKGTVAGIFGVDSSIVSVTFGGRTSATDANTTPYEVTVTLSGEGIGNYELSATTLYWSIGALDLSGAIIHWVDSHEYTGSAITPTFTITVNGVLIPSSDYDATWTNNTNEGEATLVISAASGNGSCTGSAEFTFTITPKEISAVQSGELTYNGTEQTPGFVLNGVVEKDNGCVSVTHSAKETDAGAYEATLTLVLTGSASGNYVLESTTVEWSIGSYDIAGTDVSVGTIDDQVYKGSEITPGINATFETSAMQNAIPMVSGVDYNLSYSANVNVGTATVTVEGTGNFTGTRTVTFNITQATVAIGWGTTGLTYNGLSQIPTFTITGVNGATVGRTYLITGDNVVAGTNAAIHAGSYTISITGLDDDNYKLPDDGTATTKFSIAPKELTVIQTNIPTYDGVPHTPSFVLGGVVGNDDVKVATSDSATNAGTYSANVKLEGSASGDYTIDATASWRIDKASATIVWNGADGTYTYDGNDQKGSITAVFNGISDQDLAVTVTLNGTTAAFVNAGEYTFAVDVSGFENNYVITGDMSVTVTMQQRPVSASQDGSLTYNGSAQAPVFKLDGIVNNDVVIAGTTDKQTDAGTYTSRLSLSGVSAGNYVLSNDEVQWTIGKAGGSVVWTYNKEYTYSGADHIESITAVFNGVGSETSKSLSFALGSPTVFKDAGTYVFIADLSDYEGNYDITGESVTLTMHRLELEVEQANIPVYDGNGHIPSLDISGVLGVDGNIGYVITSGSETDAGEYTATVLLTDDNYALPGSMTEYGEYQVQWKIEKRSIAGATIELGAFDAVYDAKPKAPDVISVTISGLTVPLSGIDVTYGNNTNAGTAYVHVDAQGCANFTGTAYRSFTIEQRTIIPSLEKYGLTFNGGEQNVVTGYSGHVDGDDVIVNFTGTLSATAANGDYRVYVSLDGASKDNYRLSATELVWHIHRLDIGDPSVNVSDVADRVYTGVAIMPDISASVGDYVLTSGVDYSLAYSGDNINVTPNGVTINVTGSGNFTGERTVTFQILPKDLKDVTGADWRVDGSYVYDGAAHAVTVSNHAGLFQGNDYTVYSDAVVAGSHSAIITGVGNYTGTVGVGFIIAPAPIDGVTLDRNEWTYTGVQIRPAVTKVTAGSFDLVPGDYDITYGENVNAGTGTVTVQGKGNYGGSYVVRFTISAITHEGVHIAPVGDVVYNGTLQRPGITATAGGLTLSEGRDYILSWSDNVNAGTATIVVEYTGNYTGSERVTFNIVPKQLTEGDMTFVPDSTVYNGSPIRGVLNAEGWYPQTTDYSVSYRGNVNAGTATVTVSGVGGNVIGSLTFTFVIDPMDIADAGANWTVEGDHVYQGGVPDVTVTNDMGLVEGVDFTVSVSSVHAGSSTVTISGIGNYTGNVYLEFQILERPISYGDFDVDYVNTTYAGVPIEKPVVSLNGLVQGVDYRVTYIDNLYPGLSTIRIEGIGSVTGVLNYYFTIHKAPLTITADDVVYRMGHPGPNLTYTIEGLRGDDTAESLAQLPVLRTNFTGTQGIGVYDVVLQVFEDRCYDITFVNGTLTVEDHRAVVNWGSLDLTFRDRELAISVTATNAQGETVSLQYSVYMDGREAVLLYVGTYTVTAVLPEGWELDTSVEGNTLTQTVTIHEPSLLGNHLGWFLLVLLPMLLASLYLMWDVDRRRR